MHWKIEWAKTPRHLAGDNRAPVHTPYLVTIDDTGGEIHRATATRADVWEWERLQEAKRLTKVLEHIRDRMWPDA
jgi:hypothetical protein